MPAAATAPMNHVHGKVRAVNVYLIIFLKKNSLVAVFQTTLKKPGTGPLPILQIL